MQQIACRQQPRLAPRHRAQPALRPQRQESERQASCCEMAANLALRSRPKGQRAQLTPAMISIEKAKGDACPMAMQCSNAPMSALSLKCSLCGTQAMHQTPRTRVYAPPTHTSVDSVSDAC